MNVHLAEISRTVAPGAHAVLVLDGAGWHRRRQAARAGQHHPAPAPALQPGAQPGRERLAVPPRKLARHQRLRRLRRHRRRLLQRLEPLIDDPARITSIATRDWAQVTI